ncbi:flagellar export protein FliJ [Calycomorphotria hydatis]|uniref:Flagellar biosynthesis chaperone n=1 Tax=Calycomorphotria hydatis TaxID=2528027 RepID=A0A517TBA2_9PLAN|nr:flagellar FliJ family protein [Calycomorphotria hydatis]QDT65647.1 flagellar biosynthesis chaperone [Calycomorphotria hydatis]
MAFRFRLAAVLKWRENRRDLVRQVMSQVLEEESRLQTQIGEFSSQRDEQLEDAKRISSQGAVDVDRVSARRYYASQLAAKATLAERELMTVREQLQACRQALAQADADVKAMEQLKAKQLAEHEKLELDRVEREATDQWSARNIKRLRNVTENIGMS